MSFTCLQGGCNTRAGAHTQTQIVLSQFDLVTAKKTQQR